nr:hypothetical protein [Tanacetum cinerariifolium]
MDQPNPTFAKILILDTGKFEQWKFRIQQYLQNKHYALWEVIEFGDSYKAPPKETGKGPASESFAKKKGRTVVITTEDMQKRKNDVKARTTLLLALPDEHQLRLSKLQAIVSHLEFMDVEIVQDDLNHKFLTSLAPEWLISGKGKVHTASVLTASIHVSTVSTDVAAASLSHDTIDEDDIKEMDIKWNMALLSMRADRFWKKTADNKVLIEFALMAKSSSSLENERDVEIRDNKIEYLKNELEQVKKEKESLDKKLIGFENASKDLDNLLKSQRSDKNKEGLRYNAVPPPPAQVYSPPKKDLYWTGLPEFVEDTVTDYSRPTPSIDITPLFVKKTLCHNHGVSSKHS